MPVSRRHFLVVGQTLLAAMAVPTKFFGAAAGFSLGTSTTANLLTATKATFQPLVNSGFAVGSASFGHNWLTLLSVEDLNAGSSAKAAGAFVGKVPAGSPAVVDTFALHFYGTGEALEQGTYELVHPKLGKFSLFIVPSGTSRYTAIVSHLQGAVPVVIPKKNPLQPRLAVSAKSETLSLR